MHTDKGNNTGGLRPRVTAAMGKAAAVCTALLLLLAGCGRASPAESVEPPESVPASKWFDCLHGDELPGERAREYQLEAFPGVAFRCHAERLEAVTETETLSLYEGMPIWSVYFYDLTGDGKPELCSSLSMGSGLIDNRIVVYDFAASVSYELSDRGHFDYVLNMRDGALTVEKRAFMQEELAASGELVFLDDTLQIKTK